MIRALVWLAVAVLVWRVLRPGSRPAPRAPARRPPADWDPYAVLGVPRGASRDEITRHYREQLHRYHPDRVADLGDELRDLAHEKTIALRRAYDELTR